MSSKFVCLLFKLGCFSWFSTCASSVINTREWSSTLWLRASLKSMPYRASISEGQALPAVLATRQRSICINFEKQPYPGLDNIYVVVLSHVIDIDNPQYNNRYHDVWSYCTCDHSHPHPSYLLGGLGALLSCHRLHCWCCLISVSTLAFTFVFQPLWSSDQFLATDPEARVRFPALPDFLSSVSGMGSTQPLECNWGATWKKK
jgi:hypothetical protein